MAKFEVQSGSLRMVVHADDARKAALWAVHRAMQQILPIYDDASLTATDKERCAVRRGCAVMGEVMRLRRIEEESDTPCGGERLSRTGRAVRFATFDVVTEWNRLMVALARLEQQLAAAV